MASFKGQPTDLSGSITLGGTAQTVKVLTPARSFLFIHNPGEEAFYYDLTGTAVSGRGVVMYPGGSTTLTPGDWVIPGAISIIGPTTGQRFTIWELALDI